MKEEMTGMGAGIGFIPGALMGLFICDSVITWIILILICMILGGIIGRVKGENLEKKKLYDMIEMHDAMIKRKFETFDMHPLEFQKWEYSLLKNEREQLKRIYGNSDEYDKKKKILRESRKHWQEYICDHSIEVEKRSKNVSKEAIELVINDVEKALRQEIDIRGTCQCLVLYHNCGYIILHDWHNVIFSCRLKDYFQYSETYANRDAICLRIYTEIGEIIKKIEKEYSLQMNIRKCNNNVTSYEDRIDSLQERLFKIAFSNVPIPDGYYNVYSY